MDHRQLDPRLGTRGRRLVVLGEAPIPPQPGERPLHHPPPRQDDETTGRLLHHLQPDRLRQPPGGHPVGDAAVRPVGPHPLQPAEPPADHLEQQLRPVGVVHVGGMHHHSEDQAERIDQDVPLAAGDLLSPIVAAGPPFSVVLTDWLSTIAAEGCRWRPSAARRSPRSASWMRSSVPSLVQTRKYHWTVPHGGKSWGKARHWQPVRATYRSASTISLRSCLAGRPPGLGGGTKRSTWAHSDFVRSLGYGLRVSIPPD